MPLILFASAGQLVVQHHSATTLTLSRATPARSDLLNPRTRSQVAPSTPAGHAQASATPTKTLTQANIPVMHPASLGTLNRVEKLSQLPWVAHNNHRNRRTSLAPGLTYPNSC